MTLKQRNFIGKYLATSNATEAAMQVYKPRRRATARAIGSENLAKPNIQRTIQEVLEEDGLDTKLVVRSLVEDIKGKPLERVAELLLASKLLGLLDRAKQEEENRERPLPIPIFGGLSISQEVAEKNGIQVENPKMMG